MKYSVASKEMLVLPMKTEVIRKKNEISHMAKVCNKFGRIFKFFMFLLLIVFLIWIGYIAIEYYTTNQSFCGTMNNIYDEETLDIYSRDSPSYFDKEMTESPEYNATIHNIDAEMIEHSSEEIIWSDLAEHSSEETTEKLKGPVWNYFLPERPSDTVTYDEVDDLESTSVTEKLFDKIMVDKEYEDDEYYDCSTEAKEEVKEIQGKNMKNDEKQDDVIEKVFDDKIEPYNSLWELLGPIAKIQNETDYPAIEIESSNNNDEIVSNEDIEFDKLWNVLSLSLDTIQDETESVDSFLEDVTADYNEILCMLLNFGLKNILTNPAVSMTEEDRLVMDSGTITIQNAVEICKNISNFTSVSAFENHNVKRSIYYGEKDNDNLNNRILRNAIQTGKMMLLQKLEQIDESDYQSLEPNLEEFFNRMELLSEHIDRLHERYLKFNDLNDDYISKEFPME